LLIRTVIGARRAAWRTISSIEQKEKSKGNDGNVTKIKSYAAKIDKELNDIVNDVTTVIDKHLIPHATGDESKVFYYKMKGDYFRYKDEYSIDEARKEGAQRSLEGYTEALKIAQEKLPTTNPIRLGLALNFSVFYYEILNEQSKACELAKSSFDDAIAKLDDLSEDSYKDSTVIMQLLRDNLTLWTTEGEGEDDD